MKIYAPTVHQNSGETFHSKNNIYKLGKFDYLEDYQTFISEIESNIVMLGLNNDIGGVVLKEFYHVENLTIADSYTYFLSFGFDNGGSNITLKNCKIAFLDFCHSGKIDGLKFVDCEFEKYDGGSIDKGKNIETNEDIDNVEIITNGKKIMCGMFDHKKKCFRKYTNKVYVS